MYTPLSNTPYWCEYVTNWVADKTRCQLSVDPAEHNALAERLDACPDQPITVTYARCNGCPARHHGGSR